MLNYVSKRSQKYPVGIHLALSWYPMNMFPILPNFSQLATTILIILIELKLLTYVGYAIEWLVASSYELGSAHD